MKEPILKRLTARTDWMLLRHIICIAAGILLWIYPDAFATGVVIGAGILLVLYGVISFLLSFRHVVRNLLIHTASINSIVSLAVGLAFIIVPTFFAKWFLTVLGIIIIGLALLQLLEIASLRKYANSISALLFLSPLVLLGIGIAVMLKPEGLINLLGYFCSGALIYTGISGIFLAIRIRREGKHLTLTQQQEGHDTINS
jgi:uncharacterized membrane protein HdeD (DUF308 family)